jgi:phosphohistidine phosphatase
VKTLHLLRHAKSDWSDPSLADHDRVLNRRGRRTLPVLVRHVDGWRVDLVVVSTAARAQATAAPLVEALHAPARDEPALYEAGTAGALDVVRSLPDDAGVVLLVGHNPTMEDLTEVLCGSSPRYSTGALGTVTLAVERWRDVAPRSGTLSAHVTPAQLTAEG